MSNNKPIAEVIDGKVYVLQAGTPILVKTADVCQATGKTNQWIGQLVAQGTLNKLHTPFGGMFEIKDTLRAYIDSRVEDGSENREKTEKADLAKLQAEAALKATKAKKESLLLKELEGKMHRSEDVEALTTDLVFTVRSALMALPGRLSVAVADAKDAAEVSSIITREVHEALFELSHYNYNSERYAERVRQRLKLGDMTDEQSDEEDD